MLSPQVPIRKNGTQQSGASIVFSNTGEHQSHLKGFLNPRLLGPTYRVSDPTGLVWGLRMCIYNNFPNDADAAGLGTTHQEKVELALTDNLLYAGH